MQTFIGKEASPTASPLLNRTFIGGASALSFARTAEAVSLSSDILSALKVVAGGMSLALEQTASKSNRI